MPPGLALIIAAVATVLAVLLGMWAMAPAG